MSPPDTVNDARVDTAVEEFIKACPGTQLDVQYKRRGDWTEEGARIILESIMVIDSGVTAVLAANDRMAIGALKAASEFYEAQNRERLLVSGYTNEVEVNKMYVKRQEIFATVDEQLKLPDRGVWLTIRQV